MVDQPASSPGSEDSQQRLGSARHSRFIEGRRETVSDSGAVSRDALLTAAASAFREDGFERTSIDALARRMGATKGLVYHHYRSKDDLYGDVCRRGFALALSAVAPEASARDRAVSRLRRMIEAHVRAVLEHAAVQQAMLHGYGRWGSALAGNPAVTTELDAERARYVALFGKTLAAAVTEGDLVSPIAAPLALGALMAVIDAPVFWPAKASGAPKHLARDLALFALRGAGAGAGLIEEEF